MVQYSSSRLDAAFAALSNSSRRAILQQVAHREASVSQLAGPLGVSLPALQKHLRVLERAGLITHEKRGRVRQVRLANGPRPGHRRRAQAGGPLREATDWITQFDSLWDTHLNKLKHQIESDL